MTSLAGFLLGSFLGSRHAITVQNNTKVIREYPITSTEIAEHEERLRRIKG